TLPWHAAGSGCCTPWVQRTLMSGSIAAAVLIAIEKRTARPAVVIVNTLDGSWWRLFMGLLLRRVWRRALYPHSARDAPSGSPGGLAENLAISMVRGGWSDGSAKSSSSEHRRPLTGVRSPFPG